MDRAHEAGRRRRGRPRPKRVALASALVLLVSLVIALFGPAVSAQESEEAGPVPVVHAVDATDPSAVVVTFAYAGPSADVEGLRLVEEGRRVDVTKVETLTEAGTPTMTGVVLDNASVLDTDDALVRAKEGSTSFLNSMPPGDQGMVMSVGDGARIVQTLTSDSAELVTELNAVPPRGEALLWDGLVDTVAALGDHEGVRRSIVLFAGSEPGKSRSRVAQARGSASAAGVVVHVVALDRDGVPISTLRDLAEVTGGQLHLLEDTADIPAAFETVRALEAGRYQLTFTSREDVGPGELSLFIGGEESRVTFGRGSVTDGVASLTPDQPPTSVPGALQSSVVKWIAVVLALVATAMAVYAIALMFVPDPSSLELALRPYQEELAPSEDAESGVRSSSLASTQIVQRAVELTGQIAEKRGLLQGVEHSLERANMPLRPAEALFFYLAAVLFVAVASFVLLGGLIAMGLVTLFVASVPPLVVKFKASRRKKTFNGQLPDMLRLLAGTLRAGYSFMQGVETVSEEIDDPMGGELRRVVAESRLGRPLEESLDAMAERMDSSDFAWAVVAVRIQREVGGNLAELLLTVAETMTARERLSREVSALTAEGRVSAIVLGILPVGLGLVMWLINPSYIGILFEKTLGNILLAGSGVMALAGFWWMKKIVDIDL